MIPKHKNERINRLRDEGYSVQELLEAAYLQLVEAAESDPEEVDYRIALAHVAGARAVMPLSDD